MDTVFCPTVQYWAGRVASIDAESALEDLWFLMLVCVMMVKKLPSRGEDVLL